MCLRKIMIRRRPTSNVLAGLRFFRRDGLPRQPYRDMIVGARSGAVLGSLFLVVFPWFVVSGRRRFGSVVWPGRFVGRVVRVARRLPRMGRTVTGRRRHRTRRHGPYGARGYRQCGGQDPSEGQYAADFHDSRFLGSTNGVVRPVRYGGTVIRTEGIAFIKDSEKKVVCRCAGSVFWRPARGAYITARGGNRSSGFAGAGTGCGSGWRKTRRADPFPDRPRHLI